MTAGPAPGRRRGFSLLELILTLAALALVAWLVLRIVDRGTRVTDTLPATGPEAVLQAAFGALRKDVAAAAAGGLDLKEAIRPVADNTAAGAAYLTPEGARVAVRPGTDQLGLRGVLRSPLVTFPPAAGGFGRLVQAAPQAVPLHLPASPELARLRARVKEVPAGAKAFLYLRDASARGAVARVVSANLDDAGPLDLVLDASDADARARNPGGDANAALALDAVVAAGVFDDLVWFVARGPEGRPPDFVLGSDPASLAFPHPYLALAVFVGDSRWDVRRTGDDVEDLQVAWGLGGPGSALVWRGEAPASPPPRPEELADAAGRPALRSLRVALVARAPQRLPRSGGSPPPEFASPLNRPAPEASPDAAPVGWDPAPQRRIRFDREVREETLPVGPVPGAR